MENFGKDLLYDIEEQQYGMYIGHNVVYLNEKLIKILNQKLIIVKKLSCF